MFNWVTEQRELKFGEAQHHEHENEQNTGIAIVETEKKAFMQMNENVIDLNNQFVNSTPKDMAERQYMIFSADVAPSTQELDVHHLLITEIEGFLKSFKYYRAGVKIVMNIVSVPQIYGYGILSWLPQVKPTDPSYNGDPQFMMNTVLFSLSSQDVVEYHIPWICPKPYIKIGTTDMANVILRIPVLERLSEAVPSTVRIQIWANFEDFDCMGPQAQSGERGIMPVVEYGEPISSSIGTTLALSSLSATMAVREIYNMVVGTSKVTDMVTKTYKSAQQVQEMVRKKTDLSRDQGEGTSVKMSPYGDLSSISTQNASTYLGEERMPLYHSLDIGSCEEYFSMASLLSNPSLVGRYTLTSGTFNINLDPLGGVGYFSFMAKFFRFWRGSINYSFHFFTSPLISSRFTLQLSEFGAGYGDTFTEVLPVRGDVTYKFNVPYMWTTPWHFTDVPQERKLLLTTLSPPVGSTDRVAKVFLVIYRTAGEDFAFSSQRAFNASASAQSMVKDIHRAEFPSIGRGRPIFAYPYNRVCESPSELCSRYSFRNTETTPSYVGPNTLRTLVDFNLSSTFDVIAQLFLYHRGTVSFKIPTITSSVTCSASMSNGQLAMVGPTVNTSNGTMIYNPQIWPIVEFDAPYLCEAMASLVPDVLVPNTGPVDIEVTDLENHGYYVKGGTDYLLSFLLPPPLVNLWNPNV